MFKIKTQEMRNLASDNICYFTSTLFLLYDENKLYYCLLLMRMNFIIIK